ncbi:carbohydrate ABC transporter permease [Candidatus Pristimantibacillus sp. PTI5]|uniref:carbohydrate ABC transporter permease n=1 Tax=Candidatus Pristimantibacillus sp. PTI5 TaxID=3400422 RepID=UPI003B01B726
MQSKYRMRISRKMTGFLLTLPALIVLGVTILYPLLWALKISFSSSNSVIKGTNEWVGLENYIGVLGSKPFLDSLWNTSGFVGVTIVMELAIGLIIAVALNKRLPANGLFVVIFSLPLMMAPIVSGFIWRWLFADQYGIINHFITLLGMDAPIWLSSPFWAKASVLISNLWGATPFVILVLYAGLTGISDDVNEAAEIDGARGFRLFRYITLPLLKPAILLVLVIRVADAFRMYDVVYILTGGGPGGATNVLNTFIYRRSFSDFQFGEGAAASFIVLFIIVMVSLAIGRILSSGRGEQK